MNIFCNGLSLLSVNSLEMHREWHLVGEQNDQMVKIAKTVESHSSYMRSKTQEMISKLKADIKKME